MNTPCIGLIVERDGAAAGNQQHQARYAREGLVELNHQPDAWNDPT